MNNKNSIKNLIIFASGYGSNAEVIINFFKPDKNVKTSWLLSNKQNARALQMGKDNGLHTLSFDRTDFYETDKILNLLLKEDPDLIILAGFLWKVPEKIVQRFPRKIINIHPALLPKYGGKGMYGNHVHQAVLANKEAYSGISIHYVNAFYDEGQLIAQFKTPVTAEDDLDSLKEKIQKLEHENFAKTIKTLLFPEN